MWRDTELGAAILAAPVFWGILFLVSPSTSSFTISFSQIFILAFCYPVLEEVVFRGFIQEILYKRYNKYIFLKISAANFLTSILFSLFHLIHHSTIWSSAVFFPSLYFGYFKEKYASLYPSILLHIFYNLGYFLLF